LASAGIGDFLIHGGGSSVLARGSQATGRGHKGQPQRDGWLVGWLVGVRHPTRPDRRLAEIRLRDRALATSGSWAQSFVYGGRRLGHILDPRTGRPAEGVLSTTVVAPSAALADALSTAFYVMGPQKSLDFCRGRPELGVLLACPGRGPGGVEVHSAGLDEEELTLLV
jgi:thiamine biosynthesis lipoprotein